jgi:hypothetical protein
LRRAIILIVISAASEAWIASTRRVLGLPRIEGQLVVERREPAVEVEPAQRLGVHRRRLMGVAGD